MPSTVSSLREVTSYLFRDAARAHCAMWGELTLDDARQLWIKARLDARRWVSLVGPPARGQRYEVGR